MKKWTRVLALGLSAAMLMAVAGCSNSGETDGGSSAPSGVSANEDTKDYQLVTDGVLTVGTNAEFPPFEFLSNNEIDGVDPAMVKAIGEKLGLKVEIKDMAFDSLDSALTGGQVDMIAAGYTITSDRLENMDFADSYYTAEQTIIVRSDSGYTSKEDLKGKVIGGQTGTTGLITSAEEITESDNIKGYSNGATAVQDLLNGNLDAVIIDNNPAKEYKEQHSDELTLITGQFEPEKYAYAVRKGNTALQQAINDALQELKDDGTFDQIIDEYIK